MLSGNPLASSLVPTSALVRCPQSWSTEKKIASDDGTNSDRKFAHFRLRALFWRNLAPTWRNLAPTWRIFRLKSLATLLPEIQQHPLPRAVEHQHSHGDGEVPGGHPGCVRHRAEGVHSGNLPGPRRGEARHRGNRRGVR